MRGIKIDVIEKRVYEVEFNEKDILHSIYFHLHADCMAQVGRGWQNGDTLVVDDNGLLIKEPLGAFIIGNYPQVLSGHGVIYGTDSIGETIPAQSSVEEVAAIVRFVDKSLLPRPKIEIYT